MVILLFVSFSTAGLPQYGQLGHGTDNEVLCNALSTLLPFFLVPMEKMKNLYHISLASLLNV